MAIHASAFVPCRECTCSALRRASRAVTQHYETCFRGTGLRATQFTLLATLIQTGPLPMGELANQLGMERTSLTRNLRLLEKKGLVGVVGDKDQRVRRVAMTRKGEAVAAALLPVWKRAQASAGEVLRRSGAHALVASRAT
jgi:DNA-binding MarR family transcriptional regulator